MAQTKDFLALLRMLSDLDVARRRLPADAPSLAGITLQIEDMRDRLPTSLLIHYDLRRSRGKPAVAPVNGGICSACHLALPSGLAAELRRGGRAVHVCTNCGVFIFREDARAETAPSGNRASPPVKPRRKTAASRPA